MADIATEEPLPWHCAYPKPKSTPGSLTKGELLQLIRERARPGRDFLLVDLRRNDHEVRGSPVSISNVCYHD